MTKTKLAYLFASFIILLSCTNNSQNLVTPTSQKPTQTNTPIPTTTQRPTTPTVTAFPPLQTSGPYFSYFRKTGEEYQLVMLDADGKGRKEISFPLEIQEAIANQEFYPSINLLSPNGDWMAYFTGTAGKLQFPFDPTDNIGPFDLKLNLLNLTTLETETSISLLSEDYPNNFIEAEKQINDPNINAITLQGTFVVGITQAIAWSPDGKYLAFAGQMDGLSSDLYVYEVETKEIRRLSSGLQELQWVSWSPDGQKILYGSTYIFGVGTIYDIYIINLDGSSAQKIGTSTVSDINWLNSNSYFEYENENVWGSYDLKLVNVVTGDKFSIWKGTHNFYNVDKMGEAVAVTALLPDEYPDSLSGENFPSTTSGLYIINLSTFKKSKIEFSSDGDFLNYRIYPFGLNNQKFILLGEGMQAYFVSENLELMPIDLKDINIAVAPNNNIWAGLNKQFINIYKADNTLLKSIPFLVQFPINNRMIWNMNSTGFFLIDETKIHFVSVEDGSVALIESDLFQDYLFESYLWVNDK